MFLVKPFVITLCLETHNRLNLSFACSFVFFLILCQSPFVLADDSSIASFGSLRFRNEIVQHPYQANAAGQLSLYSTMADVGFSIRKSNFNGMLELRDARAFHIEPATPLGNDDVNVLEPIQVWLGWRHGELFSLQLGRMTLDVGSRRLIGRQVFRNTVNSFDGIQTKLNWHSMQIQAMYLRPVLRLPNSFSELADHKQGLDKTGKNEIWGIHSEFSGNLNQEFFYFGYSTPAAKGPLHTIGYNLKQFNFGPSNLGKAEFNLELMQQFGHLQQDIAKGHLIHTEIGYMLSSPGSPRIFLLYDYVSGDKIGSAENERFNQLYGLPRLDFGAVGLIGGIKRANLKSPALKFTYSPTKKLHLQFFLRQLITDQATDLSAHADLQDLSGASGNELGTMFEGRFNYKMTEKLSLEAGLVLLQKSLYLQTAPGVKDPADTRYLFLQGLVSW
jgi:hypothetical protein